MAETRTRITRLSELTGKTIERVVSEWTHQIGLCFTDGSVAFGQAVEGRFSDDGPEIDWNVRPDNDTALALELITPERHAGVARKAKEFALALKRQELEALEEGR